MNKILSINELRELKKELRNKIEASENDWLIEAYYRGFDRFIEYFNTLQSRKLNDLNITEIKAINFINKINIYDLEYIFKSL